MHNFLFNCHEGVDGDPCIAEQSKLLKAVAHQSTVTFDVHKYDFCQALIVASPTQKRSKEVSFCFRDLDQDIFSHKYLFYL